MEKRHWELVDVEFGCTVCTFLLTQAAVSLGHCIVQDHVRIAKIEVIRG